MSHSLEHKAQLYHQLYVGVKANLPLHVIIDTERVPPAFHTPQLAMVPRLLQKGRPLSAVLAYAKVITPWEEALIKIGEDAGRLDGVLSDLEIFFVTRHQQYKAVRSRLIYPALTFVVAVLAGPAPALAAGKITGGQFLFAAIAKCIVLYGLYRLLIVRSLERSAAGAVDPVLVALALRLDPDHWLRQIFEVAYLNLLILCLASGIDAVSALRLMQGLMPGNRLFQKHSVAISQIDTRGVTLTQALVGSGIILNYQLGSFLNSSEQSGTLHSDLKHYLAKRNTEMNLLFTHKLKQMANYLYVAIVVLALLMFASGQQEKPANPFAPTAAAVQPKISQPTTARILTNITPNTLTIVRQE
jgi:type II secretory pathway component PulF